MNRLIVYLNGTKTGILEQDDDAVLTFQYDVVWLSRQDAYPLSKSLPLRPEPFHGKDARPFFAGILPEDEPRKKIAAILGISAENDFAMLQRIGGECAGAVSLLPEDVPVSLAQNRLRQLSDDELSQIIAELPRRPLMAGETNVRLSLAGAQDKLPVVFDKNGVSLPLGNSPSSHIIKPESARFPGLVSNEAFCMSIARLAGLNVPEIQVRKAGDIPYLMINRYDRIIHPDGTITRIHQEDFCQALGLPPERKYQQEGGPQVRNCITLLRDWSSVPVADIRDFIDGLVFNLLIGNADAHGKNYSMLYPPGARRLAPFYDLLCTLVWPELSQRPAMKIGGSEAMNDIALSRFQAMAKQSQLGWPLVREHIAELSQKIRDALDNRQLASMDDAMTAKVRKLMSERTTRMLSQLE
jgi:serine/threonine-protein kinase HipA